MKYEYTVCTGADEDIFLRTCKTLEKRVPNIKIGRLLEDVDGSSSQHYFADEKEIIVYNDYLVGAVYIESDVELDKYIMK